MIGTQFNCGLHSAHGLEVTLTTSEPCKSCFSGTCVANLESYKETNKQNNAATEYKGREGGGLYFIKSVGAFLCDHV